MKLLRSILLLLVFTHLITACNQNLSAENASSTNNGNEAVSVIETEPENSDPTIDDNPVSEDELLNNPCLKASVTASLPSSNSSLSGQFIVNDLLSSNGTSRDRKVGQYMSCGHFPRFMENMQAIKVNHQGSEIVFCVSPDYLSLGTNNDFIRFPLGLTETYKLLGSYGMILPTRKMVNLIYQQADSKIAPRFMTPGPQMESTDYINQHNDKIRLQVNDLNFDILAGHKKDVVISNRLNTRPNRIAIYGWHQTNGDPIQPLSTVHHKEYADYSHGIRMISQVAFIDGNEVDIRDLLVDSNYSGALSDEGSFSRSLLNNFTNGSLSCN